MDANTHVCGAASLVRPDDSTCVRYDIFVDMSSCRIALLTRASTGTQPAARRLSTDVDVKRARKGCAHSSVCINRSRFCTRTGTLRAKRSLSLCAARQPAMVKSRPQATEAAGETAKPSSLRLQLPTLDCAKQLPQAFLVTKNQEMTRQNMTTSCGVDTKSSLNASIRAPPLSHHAVAHVLVRRGRERHPEVRAGLPSRVEHLPRNHRHLRRSWAREAFKARTKESRRQRFRRTLRPRRAFISFIASCSFDESSTIGPSLSHRNIPALGGAHVASPARCLSAAAHTTPARRAYSRCTIFRCASRPSSPQSVSSRCTAICADEKEEKQGAAFHHGQLTSREWARG